MIPFPSVREVFALLASTPEAEMLATCHRGAMWARGTASLIEDDEAAGRWLCFDSLCIAAMASCADGWGNE